MSLQRTASSALSEDTLIASGRFRLPGKKKLLDLNHEIEIIVVDVTESPIERPKKKQKYYYSGKKKRHTLKTQVVVNQSTQEIICTAYAKGIALGIEIRTL